MNSFEPAMLVPLIAIFWFGRKRGTQGNKSMWPTAWLKFRDRTSDVEKNLEEGFTELLNNNRIMVRVASSGYPPAIVYVSPQTNLGLLSIR